jgi:hypothetical protein
MTQQNKKRLEKIREEIQRNRAQVERQLAARGADPKAAGTVSVAKYFVALKKLAHA